MARDYAAFRAKVERERKVWFYWPSAACAGTLTADDYDEGAYQYHLYVQWQCDEQKRWLRDEAKKNGATLYLDFPLGVNRDGYDVWRERNLFALSANGGAPPDSLFVKGQDWGFPPLHPDAIRGQGYRYYIDCIRHHMALAGMLRIDHIMAGGKGERLYPLTQHRAKPAVPFGGRYRIIDFVLSNFVNSGILSIYVVTQFKAQSLLEHLDRGWRTTDFLGDHFVTPVPAQMRSGEDWYQGTADCVYQNLYLLERHNPRLVAVFGADHIYRMLGVQVAP